MKLKIEQKKIITENNKYLVQIKKMSKNVNSKYYLNVIIKKKIKQIKFNNKTKLQKQKKIKKCQNNKQMANNNKRF